MEDTKETGGAPLKFTLKPKVEDEALCRTYYHDHEIRERERDAMLNLSKLSTLMQLTISSRSSLEAVAFKQQARVNGIKLASHTQ